MNDVSKEVSDYMSRISRRRKKSYHGFQDPATLKKALETRKKTNEAKKSQTSDSSETKAKS